MSEKAATAIEVIVIEPTKTAAKAAMETAASKKAVKESSDSDRSDRECS